MIPNVTPKRVDFHSTALRKARFLGLYFMSKCDCHEAVYNTDQLIRPVHFDESSSPPSPGDFITHLLRDYHRLKDKPRLTSRIRTRQIRVDNCLNKYNTRVLSCPVPAVGQGSRDYVGVRVTVCFYYSSLLRLRVHRQHPSPPPPPLHSH